MAVTGRCLCGAVTFGASPPLQVHFCRHCGTPLFLQYDGSEELALMVGAFDRPDEFVPGYHYGVEGRLPWVDCGQGLPERPTEQVL